MTNRELGGRKSRNKIPTQTHKRRRRESTRSI